MKRRIFFALLFSLLTTVLLIWFIVGRHIFRPLEAKIVESRADMLVTLANEITEAPNPKKRLHILEERLQIEATLKPIKSQKIDLDEKKHQRFDKAKVVAHRENYDIRMLHGPNAPMFTKLEIQGEYYWLVVRFPLDLDDSHRGLIVGLILMALVVGVASWSVSRWVFTPLEQASVAMNQIAQGNLSHRVTEDIGTAKDAFNNMADQVEGLLRSQKQLVAAISHELRTPLTRLRLQTELLAEKLPVGAFAAMNQDIAELNDLVEILLLSSKLEQGNIPLNLSSVSISEVVLDAISEVDLMDRYIDLSFESSGPYHLDAILFRRVILNLLSNIARYTPKDCTVSIHSYEKEGHWNFVVSDTGNGVATDFLPKIFEPFSRAEQSRNKVTGGFGLGLMFVKQVIVAHHGNIVAKSNTPQGLKFEVQIPLSKLQ